MKQIFSQSENLVALTLGIALGVTLDVLWNRVSDLVLFLLTESP